ncbi:MAG TPA: hypothetical protein VFJ57_13790 [Solirubrobacterales bacterium]|nr:hypothetical protein [Solirubrobacterales bacterium]
MSPRPRRSSPRFAALAALLFLLLLPALASAAGKAPEPESQSRAAAEALAQKYAPITMLREEEDPPCETTAEQYEPTSVDAVLGNPTVTLTAYIPGKGLVDVKKAPTAADIAGLSGDYYLNLTGEALGETCVYAKEFRKLVRKGKAPATTYAHIARERDHSGFALQYWFFWYFNQFNDLHEGDWEGMQITFEADSPKQALKEEPGEIIVFQHAGGERADWDDSKVQKEGTHPIVFPAAGSHATFYDSAVYVQNGQNGSGLGCDVTTEPLRELRPQPVLLPERVPRTGEFEWLSYYGRWGEREEGFNNGPQGPQTKGSWREPFTWMSEQRTTSPQLPGGAVPGLGEPVAKAFCGAVAGASELVNLDIKSRPALIASLLVIALIIIAFVGLTRWRPVDLEQLQARRSFGQMVRTSRQLYGRHWRVLVPVSIVAIPIVGGVTWVAGLLGNVHTGGDKAGRTGVNIELGSMLETIARPAAMAVVAAVVVVLVRLLVEGEERPGFRQCFRGMEHRFWRVVGAQMLYIVGLYALALTIVGLPFAVNKFVAWSFVKQEILFHDRGIRDAFHGSANLVRGRWWHTVRFLAFLFVLTAVSGPILTFALIFTNLPLIWVDLLGSLVFALLIPYVALGETVLYLDLQARAETEPAKPPRSWRPWRPRSFARTQRDWSPLPGAVQPAPT